MMPPHRDGSAQAEAAHAARREHDEQQRLELEQPTDARPCRRRERRERRVAEGERCHGDVGHLEVLEGLRCTTRALQTIVAPGP